MRSLADAIAQAGRDRFGIRNLQTQAGQTAKPAAVTSAGDVAAQTAAALLRQAVVAYAPTGTIASTVPEADGHTQQQVVGTPPGVSHH